MDRVARAKTPVGWAFPVSANLQQCLVSKGHDALKDDDVCTIQCFLRRDPGVVEPGSCACGPPRPLCRAPAYPVPLPAVRGEVIDGHLDTLPLLQFLEGGNDEVEVKGIWVVEVEVVVCGLFLLLLSQHLVGEAVGQLQAQQGPHPMPVGRGSRPPRSSHAGAQIPETCMCRGSRVRERTRGSLGELGRGPPCRRSPWTARPPRARPGLQ